MYSFLAFSNSNFDFLSLLIPWKPWKIFWSIEIFFESVFLFVSSDFEPDWSIISDVLILDELISRNAKPKYLSIELLTPHNYGIGVDVDHMAILNKLKALGYTNFVLYNQAAQRHVPTHSLEGADIE